MSLFDSLPWATDDDKKVFVRGKGLTLLPKVFYPTHPLKSINFVGNQIKYLPHDLRELTLLNLSDNKLGKFDPSLIAAINTYPKLEQLSLTDNELEEYPDSFSVLPLHILNLSDNKIQKWNISYKKLQIFGISNNLLTEFNAVMPNLQTLNLFFNKLSTFNLVSSKLNTLNLTGNDLEVLPDLEFPAIKVLIMAMNKLRDISNLPKLAPNVELLNVASNQIQELPEIPKTLSTLIANDNKIKKIPDSLYIVDAPVEISLQFNEIEEVKTFNKTCGFLYLNNNKISNVDKFNVSNSTLTHNSLTEIPDLSDASLLTLELAFNKISSINLSNLPKSLIKLSLQSNNLTEVPPELFTIGLTTLDISENHLTQLPDTFSSSHLSTFNVSRNEISEIPPLPPIITTLKACENRITKLPELNAISTLDISGNMIEEIPFSENLMDVNASRNKIKTFPKLPFTHSLDLSFNEIEEADNVNSSFVDLSHNRLKSFSLDKNWVISLKLSHNPDLEVDLNLSELKRLDTIDVANTKSAKIVYDKFMKHCLREVVYSHGAIDYSEHLFKEINDSEKCGYSEMQGLRGTMEDSIICDASNGIFAVFDGHGGSYASSISANMIHSHLKSNLSEDFRETMKVAVSNVVSELRQKRSVDGSTMCLVRIEEEKITCANIGDSRSIVILHDNTVKQLSNDHKPGNRTEVVRLREKGSHVLKGRVLGRLAVARAIGDFTVKGVDAEIEFTEIPTESVKRIIIGCDGLFDVVSNEDCLKISDGKAPSIAAATLRDVAFSRGSTDNISVIVIDI